MTKEDLLSLCKHNRIKYVGTSDNDVTKIWKKKGIVVRDVYELNDWRTGTKSIEISYFGGYVNKADPADWELVDRREWVEKDVEYKRARAQVKRTCSGFKTAFKHLLAKYKSRIDRELNSLPLDKKLSLIMGVDPNYKKWFGIINMSPEDALKGIENAYIGESSESDTSQEERREV